MQGPTCQCNIHQTTPESLRIAAFPFFQFNGNAASYLHLILDPLLIFPKTVHIPDIPESFNTILVARTKRNRWYVLLSEAQLMVLCAGWPKGLRSTNKANSVIQSCFYFMRRRWDTYIACLHMLHQMTAATKGRTPTPHTT